MKRKNSSAVEKTADQGHLGGNQATNQIDRAIDAIFDDANNTTHIG